VDDQLRSGIYRTPEDVVDSALRALREVNPRANGGGADRQEEAPEMLRFVEINRTTLSSISVKDLIPRGSPSLSDLVIDAFLTLQRFLEDEFGCAHATGSARLPPPGAWAR